MAITHGRVPIRAVKTLSGLTFPTQDFPEAATQTFKAGAPVVLSSGYLQECGADPALVMGIASRNGQNGASAGLKRQTVILAHPDVLFLGNLDNGSAGTASAATDIGKKYGIAKHGGTGHWYVDSTDTSNTRVVIWDVWDGVINGQQAAVGDTMHPVYFSFLVANQQANA
jgi:hypothetical protein